MCRPRWIDGRSEAHEGRSRILASCSGLSATERAYMTENSRRQSKLKTRCARRDVATVRAITTGSRLHEATFVESDLFSSNGLRRHAQRGETAPCVRRYAAHERATSMRTNLRRCGDEESRCDPPE